MTLRTLLTHSNFIAASPAGGARVLSPAFSLGRYRVSALVRPHVDGGYSAGVSIRSGRGSGTTDRVMRFHGRFDTEPQARHYAHDQAIAWYRAAEPAT